MNFGGFPLSGERPIPPRSQVVTLGSCNGYKILVGSLFNSISQELGPHVGVLGGGGGVAQVLGRHLLHAHMGLGPTLEFSRTIEYFSRRPEVGAFGKGQLV